jgi:hypothetical protein
MSTKSLVGNCTGDPYPDTWFPEFDSNRPSRAKLLELSSSIKYAKQSCSTCPISDDCLIEGMKDENLSHGIWGGLLAGERILSLGKVREDYGIQVDEGRALDFYTRIKPYL